MTERYTGANPPIKDKLSLLTKILPKTLRVGAIGGILLTAAACNFTEEESSQNTAPVEGQGQSLYSPPPGVTLPPECINKLTEANFSYCTKDLGDPRLPGYVLLGRFRIQEGKQIRQLIERTEENSATDREYELGKKVGSAIVIGAVIISFLTLARLVIEDEGHDTPLGWHDPDKDAGKNRPMYVRDHHPLFSATHIQPHPLEGTWFEGPKTLRGNSGVTGHLRRDAIFDRQQIISDNSGRDVGRIEPDALFEDRQVIRDGSGKRVGGIETNWRGERVIKDKDGKETGKFKKKWWGDTEIKWK